MIAGPALPDGPAEATATAQGIVARAPARVFLPGLANNPRRASAVLSSCQFVVRHVGGFDRLMSTSYNARFTA
jgi:hypothetical protein